MRRQQTLEHQQEIARLNEEIRRLNFELQDLEANYLDEKAEIIKNGEYDLEELRRRIAEYEKIINDNQSRELNAEEIERQCDELFGQFAPIKFKAQKNNEIDQKIA